MNVFGYDSSDLLKSYTSLHVFFSQRSVAKYIQVFQGRNLMVTLTPPLLVPKIKPIFRKGLPVVVFCSCICFYFCKTERERTEQGPTSSLRTASESYICLNSFRKGGFRVHVSGDPPGCLFQCNQLKRKTSRLFTTQNAKQTCLENACP